MCPNIVPIVRYGKGTPIRWWPRRTNASGNAKRIGPLAAIEDREAIEEDIKEADVEAGDGAEDTLGRGELIELAELSEALLHTYDAPIVPQESDVLEPDPPPMPPPLGVPPEASPKAAALPRVVVPQTGRPTAEYRCASH